MADNTPTMTRGFAAVVIPEVAVKGARRIQAEALDKDVRTFTNYLTTWKRQNAAAFRLYFHEVLKDEAVPESMTNAAEKCPAYGMILETAKADRKHSNVPLLFALFLMEAKQAARLLPHFTTDAEEERTAANGPRLMTGTAFANFIRRLMLTPSEWTPRILELTDAAERVDLTKIDAKNRADKYAKLTAATPTAPKLASKTLVVQKVAKFADVDPFDVDARIDAARAAEKAAKKAHRAAEKAAK